MKNNKLSLLELKNSGLVTDSTRIISRGAWPGKICYKRESDRGLFENKKKILQCSHKKINGALGNGLGAKVLAVLKHEDLSLEP